MTEKVIIRCSKACPCGDEHKRLFRGETAIVLSENATREGEADLEVITGRVAGKFQTCPRGCLQPVHAVDTGMTPAAPKPEAKPVVGVSYSTGAYGVRCDRCGAGIHEEHTAECLLASGVSQETVNAMNLADPTQD